ncbi:hypothetical protein HN51_058138, partial [Arachis hypogaea]
STDIYLHGEIPRQRDNNLGNHIPVEMINCSSLQVIILLYNNLTVKFPSWLSSMEQLTQLGLVANDFVGNIRPSLKNFSSLHKLSLSQNHLEGSITPALGRLTNLKFFALGLNNFFGLLPPSRYNLSNIQTLSLAGNQLAGNLLSNIAQEVYTNCGNLKWVLIDLGLEELTIWISFLSLTNYTQLQKLDFYKNYLGGALIILIGNLSTNLIKILLDMGLNQRSGRISGKIENLFGLGSLFMDENVLEGPFSNSIGKLKNLVIIFLSKNNLSSNISTGIGNLTILAE